MTSRWGRFTARGGSQVEALIGSIVSETKEALEQTLPKKKYRAVVLHGGYGRGEGGVEEVDGTERPHNNLDVLILARRETDPELRQIADSILQPLAKSRGIGIDVGCVGVWNLLRSPCWVMWYDTRHAHKTLLGDSHLFESMGHFRLDNIVPSDVLHLLVNRGTLLVINHLFLERATLTREEHKLLIRHAVKAIIGYGDALLFFLGQYHWSYEEKQRRMRTQTRVSESFRALYEAAAEFRFRPDYDTYLKRDVHTWHKDLRDALEEVHLKCESLRLQQDELTWESYPAAVFRKALTEVPTDARAWFFKAKKMLWGTLPNHESIPLEALRKYGPGFAAFGPKGRLAAVFPLATYELCGPVFGDLRRWVLEARSDSPEETRRSYLRQWAIHGDSNFQNLLTKFGISLGST